MSNFLKFAKVGDDENTDKLIISREHHIKKDRAKLNNPTVYQYNSEHPIHYYKLDYRYSVVRRIINDINTGLGGKA